MPVDMAKDLMQGPMWDAVCQELDERIKGLIYRLKICSLEEVKDLQGQIKIFEGAKNLPQDVVDRESDA